MLSEYIKVANCVVDGAMRAPAERLTVSVVELLRTLAHGSQAETTEAGFVPGHGVSRDLRLNTHLYGGARAHKLHVQTGLARAELAYMVYLGGAKRLRKLDMPEFYDMLDAGLEFVAWSMAMWVPALLFDGARLRVGVDIACCGPGALASDALAGGNALPSSGETCRDQERTHRAAQLLLAMCEEGAANYVGHGTHGAQKQALQAYSAALKTRVVSALLDATSGTRVPGKAMRAIVDAVAHDVELAVATPESTGALVYRAAFAHPCLLVRDGRRVCLWAACCELVQQRAASSGQLLSVQASLSAVLGCAVAGLMGASVRIGGICVDPASGVARRIEDFQREWPTAPSQSGKSIRTQAKSRGKAVGLTAALRNIMGGSLDTQPVLRAEPRSSRVSLERFRAALTMRSVAHALAAGSVGAPSNGGSTGPAADPLPTEGIVGLKRLYLSALHAEPACGKPCGSRGAASPFCEASPAKGHCALAIPASSTEMVWREVSGGALAVCGMLFPFTRHAVHASLNEDWRPLCAVVDGAAECPASTKGVMLPVTAANLVGVRAKDAVREMAIHVESSVSEQQGPLVATRSAQALDAFARTAFSHPVGALWEVLVSHVAPRPTEVPAGRKRPAPQRPSTDEN